LRFGSVRRTQDWVLGALRWLALAALAWIALAPAEGAPDLAWPLAALPRGLLAGAALYVLFLTIALLGGWAGSRLFAHFQTVGDLALLGALMAAAPASAAPLLFTALLALAVVTGLRRFAPLPSLAYAAAALALGALAQHAVHPTAAAVAAALLPAVALLLTRLLAGPPPPEDLLDRRHPFRADQALALLGLAQRVQERLEPRDLVAELHRLLLRHTGAARAAVLLRVPEGGEVQGYSVDSTGALAAKPLPAAPPAAPHARALAGETVRQVRQSEPLPAAEVVGAPGASSALAVPLRARGAGLGALVAYDKAGGRAFDEADAAFAQLVATLGGVALAGDQAAAAAAERAALLPRGLLALLALRRPEAEAHAEQVARLALALAEELGLDAAARQELHLAALLHDLGELGIPGDLFNQRQVFSADEYERIKEHPTLGARVLAELDCSAGVLAIVQQHHERWDGLGYPQRLERAAIVLGARILAVADALDAMTAERPYRPPRPVREALQEIVAHSGTQFDPAVVQALLAVVARHGEAWVATPPKRVAAPVEPWRHRVERAR